MFDKTRRQTFRSRWVIPVSEPPIPHGFVTVADGRIQEVGTEHTGSEFRDLGDCILSPALLNAHTHLEFNSIPEPIPSGRSFVDWIRAVIAWRMNRDEYEGVSAQRNAIEAGLTESADQGVALVGEILSKPWPIMPSRGACSQLCFLEQLGVRSEQASERMMAVAVKLSEFQRNTIGEPPPVGISPHAPYSVSPPLLRSLLDLASQNNLPVAMHLAESREEVEWVVEQRGPFADFLDSLGVPASQQWRSNYDSILTELIRAPKSLVIHANYLPEEQWDPLAVASDRVSVVYCPRTHQYFGHDRYPLEQYLERGIQVVLGTDSRASNPDLDILGEARFVRREFPRIPAERLFRMVTMDAAHALGVERELGSLRVGRKASLLQFSCPSDLRSEPLEWLLSQSIKPNRLDLS